MLDYLFKLTAHEYWANKLLLDALTDLPEVPPRTRELMAHIFAGHEFWDKCVHGEPIPEYDFWPRLTLTQCVELNEEFAHKWPDYIRSLPQLIEEQNVSFTTMDGTPRTFRAIDILTQLHAHSIHHRAQIMLDMKAAGLEPVTTDYLLFCRKTDHD